MTNHTDSQLGVAILAAHIHGNRRALADLMSEREPEQIAMLMTAVARVLVQMMAEGAEVSEEAALQSIAAAIAAES